MPRVEAPNVLPQEPQSRPARRTPAEHVAFAGSVHRVPTAEPQQTEAPSVPAARPGAPAPEKPDAPPVPLRTLTVTVEPAPGTERTDIQFTHRNGTVDMVVRSSNAETARILRSDLPELVRNLEEQGFHSDLEPDGRDGQRRNARQQERTDDDD